MSNQNYWVTFYSSVINLHVDVVFLDSRIWLFNLIIRTVNGFKTKLERERAKKMGLFLDWRPLDFEAVTEIRSGHTASILQVFFF